MLAANGTQTAQVTIDTDNPLGLSAMNAHGSKRSAELAGLSIWSSLSILSLPVTVFFGLILSRFRKRHRPIFPFAILLLLSGIATLLNGCNGYTQASAAPGAYLIQITATGANSNLTESQSVMLTITQ